MAHANKAEMINKRRSQIHMRDFPLNALMETRTSLPDLCALFCVFLIAFLAVLGDQKSGTNVEAPLSTIEQALENVLNRRGNAGGGEQSAILELDGTAFGRLIYRLSKSEGQRIGVDIAES